MENSHEEFSKKLPQRENEDWVPLKVKKQKLAEEVSSCTCGPILLDFKEKKSKR
jgi:hypothetical protein